MKYLVSLFVMLPILMSCAVVEEQYAPGYIAPSPRVQVVPEYRRHYHGPTVYRQAYRAPAGRVYHRQAVPGPVAVNPKPQVRVQSNVHGHNAPVVRNNVHGHGETQNRVHGHDNSNVIRHPGTSGTGVEVQQNVHGHQ